MLPTSPFKVAGPATTFALVDGTESTEGTCALGMRGGDALVDQVVPAHSAGGRLSEPVALLGRHGKPKSTSVNPSVTGPDDRRGWVTKSTTCAPFPESAHRGVGCVRLAVKPRPSVHLSECENLTPRRAPLAESKWGRSRLPKTDPRPIA